MTPLQIAKTECSNYQSDGKCLGVDFDEAIKDYRRSANVGTSQGKRICPVCRDRELEKGHRFCYVCKATKRQETKRKSRLGSE